MRFRWWVPRWQNTALQILLIINRSLSISAILTELPAHPLSSPMNLHEVDFAATRANAFDLGFPRSLGFIQSIKVLVCIFQNLRAFFLNDIGFSCFHFGPP